MFAPAKKSVFSELLCLFKQTEDNRQKFVQAFSLFKDEKESVHEGIRTLNLPIRGRTHYPLDHALSHINFLVQKLVKEMKIERTRRLTDQE